MTVFNAEEVKKCLEDVVGEDKLYALFLLEWAMDKRSFDLEEHDKKIRADAIDELKGKKDEIIRWLIKRDKEGYGTTNGELLDHILEIAEQLKEQKNE